MQPIERSLAQASRCLLLLTLLAGTACAGGEAGGEEALTTDAAGSARPRASQRAGRDGATFEVEITRDGEPLARLTPDNATIPHHLLRFEMMQFDGREGDVRVMGSFRERGASLDPRAAHELVRNNTWVQANDVMVEGQPRDLDCTVAEEAEQGRYEISESIDGGLVSGSFAIRADVCRDAATGEDLPVRLAASGTFTRVPLPENP